MEVILQYKNNWLFWVFVFFLAMSFSYFLTNNKARPTKGDIISSRNGFRKLYVLIITFIPLILASLEIFYELKLDHFLTTKIGRFILISITIFYGAITIIIRIRSPNLLIEKIQKFSLIGTAVFGYLWVFTDSYLNLFFLFTSLSIICLIVIYSKVIWETLTDI